MKFWRRKIQPLTRGMIDDAVSDPEWQKFRLSLKGVPTAQKLDMLDAYLKKVVPEDSIAGALERQVQVDNYINALLRGGQLKKLCNEMLAVNK